MWNVKVANDKNENLYLQNDTSSPFFKRKKDKHRWSNFFDHTYIRTTPQASIHACPFPRGLSNPHERRVKTKGTRTGLWKGGRKKNIHQYQLHHHPQNHPR